MQMTVKDNELLSLDHYVKKTYFKTGSLMANSCRAVALLGGHPEPVCDLSWQYGRHLGLAFQACTCFFTPPFLSSAMMMRFCYICGVLTSHLGTGVSLQKTIDTYPEDTEDRNEIFVDCLCKRLSAKDSLQNTINKSFIAVLSVFSVGINVLPDGFSCLHGCW